jgi:nitrate/nitrite transporter NarK
MRAILRIISLLALVALTLPSIIFLAGRLELDTVKWIMLVATVVWFVAAIPWMWKDKDSEQQEAG